VIVVDVKVLVYLWIPGEHTERAEDLYRFDPHWVSSVLWRSEFRNALAGYLRTDQLPLSQSITCIQNAERQMKDAEVSAPSDAVMEKVASSTCSAYDCEYVVIAEKLGCRLSTEDKKVLREFPATALALSKFQVT